MNVVSVLPREIEQRWADFLASGKTGSLEVHAVAGETASWKIIEVGRLTPHKQSA